MSLAEVDRKLVFSLSASRIFKHVEKLCEFGPRYIGSKAIEQSIAYLEGELAGCGAGVERHSFEMGHFEETGSELKSGARVAAT